MKGQRPPTPLLKFSLFLHLTPPDGHTIRDMKEKYGHESCACVGDWVKKHGIPSQGSFSLYQLQKLEERLKQVEGDMMQREQITGTQMRNMQQHFERLSKWKEEAERREKKRNGKQLPHVDALETEDKKHVIEMCTQQTNTHSPPPYNPMCPSLTK